MQGWFFAGTNWNTGPATPGHEEKIFKINSLLISKVKDPQTQRIQELKFRENKQIVGNQSITRAAGRLLTEAFSQIGAKIRLVKSGEIEKQSFRFVLNGFKDYLHTEKIREKIVEVLAEGMPEIEKLRRSRISRNEVVFSVNTSRKVEEIKHKIVGLEIDQSYLSVTDSDERMIRMEVR